MEGSADCASSSTVPDGRAASVDDLERREGFPNSAKYVMTHGRIWRPLTESHQYVLLGALPVWGEHPSPVSRVQT